jgi:phenylalanyl-tRNA synthetase beta chain
VKLPLSWLREFVDVDLPPPEFARRITDSIAEVEGWETIGGDWDADLVRVAAVIDVKPHPNADRLRLATVDAGDGPQQVVCGAPNIAAGQKVAFATEGAMLVDGHSGKLAKLKTRPIRGVDSAGMVLSEKELGLSDEHEGILVLDEHAVPGRALRDEIGDVVFDLSTWANRADQLGMIGLAREVAAMLGSGLREPETGYEESGKEAGDLVSVTVEDPDLCRRFTASVVENVSLGPSPSWMQQRLIRHGQRPINNLIDITNYVMLETGQPLHSFDYERVEGHAITARRAKEGEVLTTLDGVERILDTDMLMICDASGPVGLAGIMGGGNSEVSENTKTILLEVANFHPSSIRRTSDKLKLRSEASQRFEKGIGPAMAEYAQRRALHLYAKYAGGRVAKGLVDVYPAPWNPPPITLTDARIKQVLGVAVPRGEVTRILAALGFELTETADAPLEVRPPDWRPDVEIADDVIEEIVRIYGYDKLPPTMLRGSLPETGRAPSETTRERVRNLAVRLGFQEVINYTLTSKERLSLVVSDDDSRRMDPLGMVNPVASQHRYMRTSLRGDVLASYAKNRAGHDGALRLVEVGSEYLPTEADLPQERQVACFVLGGRRETRWPGAAGDEIDFFDAKGVVEALLGSLGVPSSFQASTEFAFLPGHTATISSGTTTLGVVGQIHPGTAAKFDIDGDVFLAELGIEELTRVLPERPDYDPPSRYPEVRQDLALIVQEDVPASRLLDVVRAHKAKGIAISATVFDEYNGEGVGAGMKSLALAIRYRAADRTLADKDVARVQQGLLKRLEGETGAKLRE